MNAATWIPPVAVHPVPNGTGRTDIPASEIQVDLQRPALIHEEVRTSEPAIEFVNFNVWYGRTQAIFDVSMPIPRGAVTALIGPSGCGKSTLLRAINRINDLLPTVRNSGDIRVDGASIFGPQTDVIRLRQRIGMVFQKPNPFPMSIFENVVYPLRIRGIRNRKLLGDVCERSLKAAALWAEVQDRLHTSAMRLSGGQQQRLCIARAIAADPDVILMDEPCSALDPIATNKIEDLLATFRGRYTVIIVTHNMQQAARVSDYTAFMYLGRLIEFGPTATIFQRPSRPETLAYVTGRFG